MAATIASTDDLLNSYTYDGLSRLTTVTQAGQTGGNTVADKRADFAYNALGQYTSLARYSDLAGTTEVATSTYYYDGLARLTGLLHQHSATSLADYSWTYDVGSRITAFSSALHTGESATYSYDNTDQLTGADRTGTSSDETYTYDDNGNRTNTGYTTGTNNRLTSDGTYNYTYDDEGNRTRKTKISDGSYTDYEWDNRDRLTKVTSKTSGGTVTQVVAFTYDTFDRKISRALDTASPFDLADAAIERYVYDGDNVLLDFLDPDGAGSSPQALAHRYLFGDHVDEVLAQEDVTSLASAGTVLWQLGDNLQSTRDLVNNSGTVLDHFSYDSFGLVTVVNGTLATRYLFTAREWDSAVALQYSRARWYDPVTGKWISEDPIGFDAFDAHLTRYVHNAPLDMDDPNGLEGTVVVISTYTTTNDSRFWHWFAPDVTGIYDNLSSNNELIDALEAYVALNGTIDRLHVSGHGACPGEGGVSFANQGQHFSTRDLTQDQIDRLKKVLAPDADVVIYGCAQAGRGAQDLANKLGHNVYASSRPVRSGADFGFNLYTDYWLPLTGVGKWNKFQPGARPKEVPQPPVGPPTAPPRTNWKYYGGY